MFTEPGRTQYDLNFNLMGFPVRIHPGFWLISILFGQGAISMGARYDLNAGVSLLVIVSVFFLSILIHELGHTLAIRMFGNPSRIVLYWLGGLAIQDRAGWGRGGSRTPREQIIISLAGPALGLLFGAVLIGITYAVGGFVEFRPPQLGENGNIFPSVSPKFDEEYVMKNTSLAIFLWSGLYVNVFWNVMNLLPVYPLDGGQVARELFSMGDKSGNGIRNSLILSLITGAFIAIMALQSRDMFMMFLFGYLAYSSYVSLAQTGGQRW